MLSWASTWRINTRREDVKKSCADYGRSREYRSHGEWLHIELSCKVLGKVINIGRDTNPFSFFRFFPHFVYRDLFNIYLWTSHRLTLAPSSATQRKQFICFIWDVFLLKDGKNVLLIDSGILMDLKYSKVNHVKLGNQEGLKIMLKDVYWRAFD